MHYVRSLVLFCGLALCLSVFAFAEPALPDDTQPVETLPLETEPDIPVVALDPDSVQAIADAVLPPETEPPADTEPTEPTVPVVDLSPDTVSAMADAVGDVLASSQAPEVAVYSASALSGGYYFEADCALGRGLKFYVPVDFAVASFATDSQGLVNMTNSTVYALCPDYPDYTFTCSRFGHFTYRRPYGSNYQTYDLDITNIVDTNLSLIGADPPTALPTWQYWIVMIVVVVLFGAIICFFRRH